MSDYKNTSSPYHSKRQNGGKGSANNLGLRKYEATTEYSFDSAPDEDEEFDSYEIQWLQYLNDWDQIEEKAGKLVRMGIPAKLRGAIWKRITRSSQLQQKNPGVYQALLQLVPDEETVRLIKQDIRRTHPDDLTFKTFNVQDTLYNVLSAYANFDPDIGYCQGMSFVCGHLVYYLNEEDAFWVLVALVKSYELGNMYRPGLPLLTTLLYKLDRLTQVYMPNLFLHFQALGVQPVMFASEWFSTVFAYSFEFNMAARIWDVFLVEGVDYLLNLALAILKIAEPQLLKFNFEESILYLKERGYHTLVTHTIFQLADSFDVSLIMKFIEPKWRPQTRPLAWAMFRALPQRHHHHNPL